MAPWIPLRRVVTDLNQHEVLATAKSWIETCRTQHEKCFFDSTPLLPTRVIDVGELCHKWAKVHISDKGERGNYVALSYCWGGDQVVVARQKSLAWLTTVIPLPKLPRTLSDAIAITPRFGFRYLWVDALCILQHSPEDKAREIQRMGSNYKKAVVTIAAATASRAADGFLLTPRNEPPRREIQFLSREGEASTIY
ncbi:hypothetical protein jhhlp_004945 [Lomentospora prolificans]|uniref:Heterokaryon incompatibility domain-containing protein n=1 Tax=Lomentospora prolificans TaxID=41688 RepID=A0A2N3N7Y2_9PEZI|nr:hypothetical protein jhhlp_004945 [Lomentospora prolificans]